LVGTLAARIMLARQVTRQGRLIDSDQQLVDS